MEKILDDFLNGKLEHTRLLFDYFIATYRMIGIIEIHPDKTMIGIDNGRKRIGWVTQLGKNFIHVVFLLSSHIPIIFVFRK